MFVDTLSPNSKISCGWVKSDQNPVLGGELGTCFDVSVLKVAGAYRMWFSWRPKHSIALVESSDGINWSDPVIVLEPTVDGWENHVNRPCVIKLRTGYHMWYTGQAGGKSSIGYARSHDGVAWTRVTDAPVLTAEREWEKVAVMCPHVIWDDDRKHFVMWYSAGELFEPDVISHATSVDGMHWSRNQANPVFTPNLNNDWESFKVTACHVVYEDGWYIMFYVGFRAIQEAKICIARSRDGVSNWERHPANPIITPDPGAWDGDACYKPCVLYDKELDLWRLWYNGRRGTVEQIGLAIHQGYELWPA